MASTSSLGNASLANASSAQAFYSHFRSATDSLLSQLSDAAPTQTLLQEAVQTYAGLSAELTKAVDSGILPSHDQAAHKRRLEDIAAALEQKRKGVEQQQQGEGHGVGKKRGGFAFKRKQPTATATPQSSPSIPTPSSVDPQVKATPTIEARQSSHLTISALNNTRYKHTSSSVQSADSSPSLSIDVTDISNSLVDLRPLAATHTILAMQIRSVTSSAVLLPPIDGSVMIHGLTNSLLSIPSCHQYRMHNSKDAVIELSTKRGSVVTLEDCIGISFVTKAEEPIKVQDFDDLINSEQLRHRDERESKANFIVTTARDNSSLAHQVEQLASTESSIGACVARIIDDQHSSA